MLFHPSAGGSVTELSVTDGYRWRTVTLIMPQRTPDSPVNIAQSRKFLELSSESVSIQPRPSPPFCSGPTPLRSITLR
jgi:hypothetical protein